MKQRLLSLLVCGAMLLSMCPPAAALEADSPDGLCPHHPEHTAECGYAPASEGTPCAHQHGPECYPQGAPSNNAYECGEDTGCMIDCRHEHDETCGYAPAQEGTPCAFVCEFCTGADNGGDKRQITITSFDELPEDVQVQIVPAGTKLADLNLPSTLSASGEEGPLTIEGVTWESDPAYDGEAGGSWLFTAVLPEGYALADGVEPPQIGVMAGGVNLLADTVVVDYLDCDENGKNWTTKQANATLLDEYTTSWGVNDGVEHWYVVRGDIYINDRPTVTGDVHLILEDGSSLTARGITVQDSDNDPDNGSPNKLTIYAQSEGGNTGRLTATATGNNRSSGIGGSLGGSCGELTINGGIIEARGNSNNAGAGAGIGGGMSSGNAGNGGNITINGGKVTATSNRNAAGIGGSRSGMGGNIIINGGKVTANSSSGGAGIGGGQSGSGGNITISGGTVTATTGSGAPGIGDGGGGSGGTFSTGVNGNAVIFANSISDQSGKNGGSWKGVIIENGTGQVYGNAVPNVDFEIPEGNTLTVPGGTKLELKDGVTMSNRGTITVNSGGTLDYTDGVIHNYSSITGESGSTINPADESWNNQESELRFTSSGTATYGGSYDLTVQVSEKPTNSLLRAIPKKTVYFYQGDTLVGSAEVDDATKQATLSIKLEGTEWNAGNHTLRASYTGSNDQFLPSETTSDFLLNVEQKKITSSMVELSQTEFTYDGQEKTPTVNFIGVGTAMTAGTDYTVSYTNTNGGAGNRTNAGNVTVTIECRGNYTGNVEKNFTIHRAVLTAEGSGTAVGTYGAKLGDLMISGLDVKLTGQPVTGRWAFADEDQILGAGEHTCPATFTPQIGPDNYEPLAADIAVTINKNPAPAAPSVTGSYKVSKDKTKFVYTVNAITGAEYSKNGSTWQDSPVFDGIEPDAEIIFYARIKETDSTLAGYDGNTGKVIFSKLPNNEKPPLSVSITGEHNNRTVTIAPVAGAEYSFDDGAYSSTNEKTGCSGYVKVAIRYAATATLNASEATEETVDTDKQEQTGFALSSVGSKTYGDAAFTLSTTGGSGTGGVTFDSSDPSVLAISGATATIKKAGDVTITATKAADNDYNEAVATLSLTIGERPITVTADSFTVLKGAAMPTLTYQITSGSLAGTDSFTTSPSLTVSVADTNTVGEFDITVSGGVLTNGDSYKITYAGGKLTVTEKAPVQLTMTANPTSLSGGGTVTLTISGLPSGGAAVVSCSDSSITINGSGASWTVSLPNETAEYTFTANYAGDAQHSGATATCKVSVTKRTSGSGNGGGGGGSTTPTYPPAVEKPGEGGDVTIKPSNPSTGDKVTITPKPDTGHEVDKITVTDKNGKPVNVTKNPDGTYSFTQPSGKVTIRVTYKPVETTWRNPFTDVHESDWYYEAVHFVHERGLMGGYGNGLFGPNNNLSRAQLAQILFNKEGRPVVNYLMDFSDVSGEAWYAEAVRWATSQGIVGGYGGGKFGPNDPITREQLAVMLWRYAGSPAATNKELHFADADQISGYALEAMRWAVENGIISGYGNGQVGPRGQATRAQVAQMLKNFLENQ